MKWFLFALGLLGVGLVYGEDALAAAARQQRILAAYSTRTILSMTTTTVTSFYTCGSAWPTAPNGCLAGRKMRRYKALDDEFMESEKIDGSLSGSMNDDVLGSDPSEREGRIALTIWSTTTTPYTWTETSIDTATTFSLSYWCSIIGQDYPPSCGG